MGLFSGIFGGGSSSVSTSTVQSNISVGVTNTIDTSALGAALLDVQSQQSANSAAEIQNAQNIASKQSESNDLELQQQAGIAALNILQNQQFTDILQKYGKAAVVLAGSFIAIKLVGKK